MFPFWEELKGFLYFDTINIDGTIFRVQYKLTAFILITFSVVLASSILIGNPINCVVHGVNAAIVTNYCWVAGTFTFLGQTDKDLYPGINVNNVDGEKRYHKYYQWVSLTLVIQAIFFYAPSYIWKVWEAGQLKMLVGQKQFALITEEIKERKSDLLCKYFMESRHGHKYYLIKYMVCEMLNLVNILLQVIFMDLFLGGEFYTYGMDVLKMTDQSANERIDPMSQVFPEMTKCTFHKFGPSGDLQVIDALCMLPLNVVNQKIYIFLWFWFMIISIITALGCSYYFLILSSTKFRRMSIKKRLTLASTENLDYITTKIDIGDWFILYRLGCNIDEIIFARMVDKLRKGIFDEENERRRDEILRSEEQERRQLLGHDSSNSN